MQTRLLIGVVAWLASGQVWSASAFWDDIARYDLGQYKDLSWKASDCSGLVETYTGENFWVHDYLMCETGQLITHTGIDFNMGSSKDSKAIVAS